MSDQQQIFTSQNWTGMTKLLYSLKEERKKEIKAERNAEMRNQRSGT